MHSSLSISSNCVTIVINCRKLVNIIINKKCFIVCPIGEDGSNVRKNSDQLLNHILKPVCAEKGFECIRIDELSNSGSITESILKHLNEANLVIADLTEHNPNAFFELGYRTALGKPTIHLKRKDEKIPFDISSIRTFDYDLTDLDSVSEVKNRLSQAIDTFDFSNSNTVPTSTPTDNFNPQILAHLFKIEDDIKHLSETVKKKDSETISLLTDKLVSVSSPEPLENVFLKSVFSNPELMRMAIEETKKQSSSDT